MQKLLEKLQQTKQQATYTKRQKQKQLEELNSKIQYLNRIAQTHRPNLISNVMGRINEILQRIAKNTHYRMLTKKDVKETLEKAIREIRKNNLDIKTFVKMYNMKYYRSLILFLILGILCIFSPFILTYYLRNIFSNYGCVIRDYDCLEVKANYETVEYAKFLDGIFPFTFILSLLGYMFLLLFLLYFSEIKNFNRSVRLLDVFPELINVESSDIYSIGHRIDDFYDYLERYGFNADKICREINGGEYGVLEVFSDFKDLRRLCRDHAAFEAEDYVGVVLKHVDGELYREYSGLKPVYDGLVRELDVLDRVISFLDRFINSIEKDVAADYSGASTSYKGLSKVLREDTVLVEGLIAYSYVSPSSVGGVEEACRALEYVARLNIALAVGDPVKIETELSILSEFVEDLIDSSTTDNVYADLVFEKIRIVRNLSSGIVG